MTHLWPVYGRWLALPSGQDSSHILLKHSLLGNWIQLLLFILLTNVVSCPRGERKKVKCHHLTHPMQDSTFSWGIRSNDMMGHVVKISFPVCIRYICGTYRSNFTHNHSSGLHTLWWNCIQDYLFVCLLCSYCVLKFILLFGRLKIKLLK